MNGEYAFVIMQVGNKGSPDRRRADEVFRFVITPALAKVDLAAYRADLDPTPGPINPQMLRKLLEARVVIADLTGRNPNVFYELGIVHSFVRPVITLADSAQLLPFDTHDERVIELGDHHAALSVTQAEEAKAALERALEIVLRADYVPGSPVAEVAARRSLDQLAPENPIAAELAAIRESLSTLRDEQQHYRRLSKPGVLGLLIRRGDPGEPSLIIEDDLRRVLQHPDGERLLNEFIKIRRSASSGKDTPHAGEDRLIDEEDT